MRECLLFSAALIVAATFNVVVDHFIGVHPGIGTGTFLGILACRLWPAIAQPNTERKGGE